jgi:hypothetical protein
MSSIQLPGRAYDVVKWVVQIVLPALATLYFSLGQIWNLPKESEIIGSITALTVFLGVLLGLSSAAYNRSDSRYDGVIAVSESEGKKLYNLHLHGDPDALSAMPSVTFKVDRE